MVALEEGVQDDEVDLWRSGRVVLWLSWRKGTRGCGKADLLKLQVVVAPNDQEA